MQKFNLVKLKLSNQNKESVYGFLGRQRNCFNYPSLSLPKAGIFIFFKKGYC
jgi:hypothetical protein